MRRPRSLIFLAALPLMVPLAGVAQRPPAVVTGRVVIPGSARADSILIRIDPLNASVWTDSTGRYRLLVPPGRFADGDSATVFATRMGFQPRDQSIQLTAGREVHADFAIKRTSMLGDRCFQVIHSTRAGEPPRSVEIHRQLCILSIHYQDKRRRRFARPP